MATNVADCTRYLKKPKGVYWQALFVPLLMTVLGVYGIIGTSCAKVVYGEYIWDPLDLAAKWDGPKGRTAAFFVSEMFFKVSRPAFGRPPKGFSGLRLQL